MIPTEIHLSWEICLTVVESYLMLKVLVEPNRNVSFSDTPFLYDHIWSYVVQSLVYPYNSLCFREGEMYRKASNVKGLF